MPLPSQLQRVASATCLIVASSLLLSGVAAAAVERVEDGNIVTESIPPIPAHVGERLRQYQNTRAAGLIGWVALGEGYGLMIRTRFGETGQLHVVDHAGGTRRQITFFDEPVSSTSIAPDGKSVLLTKDIGGNEFYQVYSLDPANGRSTLLTDGESRHGAVEFSNDGSRFAYYTTARNGRDWDIHLADPRTGEGEAILERTGTWYPFDFDPADEKLLVGQYVSITESRALIIDLATGLTTPVAESEEATSIGQAMWTANGRVLLTSDADAEVRRLRLYDPVTGGERVLTEDIAWNITGMALDPARERLAFVANEDGIDRLYLMDLQTLQREAIRQLPTGTVDNMVFDPSGKHLALQINTAKSPSDVYVLNLQSGHITQWTFSEVGGLDPEGFIAPTLVRFPTFDKVGDTPRTIPAFYYRPPGDGPFPVVVSIHGGPEGQYRPRFSSTFQYMVRELGIAVVAPNVRGSSGYGKTFVKLDNGYLREDSVKDIGALLDWIAEQPELDSARVAVRGGSYGGYMSLASMIHYNDRLACGVDVVGISNFVTFLENTKPYRQDLRRPEYGDERDPDMRAFLERISPTARAEEITRPMYIAQGLNDPRVPASESEQMLERIRSNGQEVWYFLAKDEGHGFKKKRNRDFYSASQAYFLERCLLGGEAAR